MKIEGLKLWNVELNGADYSLWVTTLPSQGISIAIRKANAFLRRKRRGGVFVKAVKSHGTLDA